MVALGALCVELVKVLEGVGGSIKLSRRKERSWCVTSNK